MYSTVTKYQEEISLDELEFEVQVNLKLYLEANFNMSPLHSIVNQKYYHLLPKRPQQKLIEICLEKYIKDFHFFFNDYNLRYKTPSEVQLSLLKFLEVKVVFPNGNDKYVLKAGNKSGAVFFMPDNFTIKTVVFGKENVPLAELKRGSYFADTPVLFDVHSAYTYQVTYRKKFELKIGGKPIHLL
jgi:hypothetical protein